MPEITNDLHIVFDIDGGSKAYHTPISRQTFEVNFDLIGLVKAALDERGSAYAFGVGRLTTMLEMRRQDEKLVSESGCVPRAQALEAELVRLTMIIAPSPKGYAPRTVDECLRDGSLDADAWAETLSSVLFFTCNYYAIPASRRKTMLDLWASAGLSSTTSLSPTEFAASLPTSTSDAGTPPT